MKLKLKRPLVFFDLETTGVDITRDRIVEMSFIKVFPDATQEVKTKRINPGIPIPARATEVHGITNEDVKDCPQFPNIAKSLYSWLQGCDLAGYNSNRFDVPMLVEEMMRSGIAVDVEAFKLVDVQAIYHKMEPRTLAAAYKYYCKKDIINAHSAQADVEATVEVLMAQIDMYEDLGDDVDSLDEFSKQNNNLDLAGRLVLDENGEAVFNFGKFKGAKVKEVFKKDPNYYNWIINGEFTQNTKQICTRLRIEASQM